MPVNFETYLQSKKIDSEAFRLAEPVLWETWKKEFEQVHPSSFTAQKLFLINPLRRIYHYKAPAAPPQEQSLPSKASTPEEVRATPASPEANQAVVPGQADKTEPAKPKPAMPKPVFKPRPKIN